jgi:hypothetical protein
MTQVNELTLEKLKTGWKDYLTVGELKAALEKYPDEAKVLVQRVEDRYYEGVDISGLTGTLSDGSVGVLPEGTKADGWPVVLKKSSAYYHALDWNKEMHEEVLRKIAGEKPEFGFDNPEERLYTEEEIESMKDQYSPAWCVVQYKDDPNNLYLDLHY